MKESFYFPHDNNAHNDPKLMAVFMKTGLAGVGLYWILIELMHQQESGKIKKSQYDDYVQWYSSHENKGETFVEHLLNIYISSELFCLDDDGFIYSRRVLENKEYRENLSKKRSDAGKESALRRQKSTSVEQNGTNAQQGKERKGKEIKGNTDTTDTVVAMQPNEYQKSMEFLRNVDIDNVGTTEPPIYAKEYQQYWVEFVLYWTEKGKTGKMRAEGEKTFEIKRRFYTWLSRAKVQFQKKPQQKFNTIG